MQPQPRTNQTTRAASRAFSLLELVLVMAIMGIMMAVAAYSIFGQGDRARIKATQATLATIKVAVGQYQLEYSTYPPSLNTLVTARILEAGKLNDGWQRPLFYDPQGIDADRPFILFSKGPDGLSPSADDIDAFANVTQQQTQPQPQ